MKQKKLTNTQIAKILDISTAAVSFALNNKPGVSEEVRQRVLDLVKSEAQNDFNYRWENTSSVKYGTILASVHKDFNAYIGDDNFLYNVLSTIQREAMQQSLKLQTTFFIPEKQNFLEYIDYLRTLKVDGIIVMSSELDRKFLAAYANLRLPLVILGNSFESEEDKVDFIEIDDSKTILKTIEYARQNGHQNIGFIKGEPFNWGFRKLFDSYTRALNFYELLPSKAISLPCDIEGAYKKMKELLNDTNNTKSQMPTLFITPSDMIAIGAMEAFKELGYKIPDDISFIGYGDTKLASIVKPTLTTFHTNSIELGIEAVNILITRIHRPDMPAKTLQISPRFIKRDSVQNLKIDKI